MNLGSPHCHGVLWGRCDETTVLANAMRLIEKVRPVKEFAGCFRQSPHFGLAAEDTLPAVGRRIAEGAGSGDTFGVVETRKVPAR
jgi:hypothetical protein